MCALNFNSSYGRPRQGARPGISRDDAARRRRRDEENRSTKIAFTLNGGSPFGAGPSFIPDIPTPPEVINFWKFDKIIPGVEVSIRASFVGELSADFGDGSEIQLVSGVPDTHTYTYP